MSNKGVYIDKLDQIKAEYKVFSGNGSLDQYLHSTYPEIHRTTNYVIKLYVIWGILSDRYTESVVINELTDITK